MTVCQFPGTDRSAETVTCCEVIDSALGLRAAPPPGGDNCTVKPETKPEPPNRIFCGFAALWVRGPGAAAGLAALTVGGPRTERPNGAIGDAAGFATTTFHEPGVLSVTLAVIRVGTTSVVSAAATACAALWGSVKLRF